MGEPGRGQQEAGPFVRSAGDGTPGPTAAPRLSFPPGPAAPGVMAPAARRIYLTLPIEFTTVSCFVFMMLDSAV